MNTASVPLGNLPLTTGLRSDQDDFVGYCSVEVADSQLGLLFPLAIFYPTQTPAEAEQLGPYPLAVARDAPIKEGRFPLVMIAYGSGGSPWVYLPDAGALPGPPSLYCGPARAPL